MNWRIDFSHQADKFLKKTNMSSDEISGLIVQALRKLCGEESNVQMGKLKVVWSGFYKIRFGRVRIIAVFDFDRQSVRVEVVDWRGNAYKK